MKIKKNNKIILLLVLNLMSTVTFAQQDVEMADGMRSDGRIYVVIAIILVIFLGLIGYLISIDRKVSRLEKRLPDPTP